MSSLYEQIGGEAAVDAAVDIFYDKILADDRIKHFFEGIDMDRQRRHRKIFLTYAFGGSPSYSGKGMRAVHKRLVEEMGLADEHVDAVIENLGNTLKELNVPDELVTQAADIAESVRNDVLNR